MKKILNCYILLSLSFFLLSGFSNTFQIADKYNDPFSKPKVTPTPTPTPTGNSPYYFKPKPINNDPFNNKPKPIINNDPFNNKPKPIINNEPFNNKPKPINNDPFNNKPKPINNDPFNNPSIPFKPKPNNYDSGAYLEIEKLYGMNSYQSAPILKKIAYRKNLSSREENMIIDFSSKLYLEGKVSVLETLLSNAYLSEASRINFISLMKKDYTFYSKDRAKLLNLFSGQYNLSINSQKNLIDAVFSTLDNEGNKEMVLSLLASNKFNKNGSYTYFINQVAQKFAFEDKKVNVLSILATEQKLNSTEQKNFIDVIIYNIHSQDNKQLLIDSLFNNQTIDYQLKDYSYQNLNDLRYSN